MPLSWLDGVTPRMIWIDQNSDGRSFSIMKGLRSALVAKGTGCFYFWVLPLSCHIIPGDPSSSHCFYRCDGSHKRCPSLSLPGRCYFDVEFPLLYPGLKSMQWRQRTDQGMSVNCSIRSKDTSVVGTPECTVRAMPLDDAIQVRTGCRKSNDVRLIGIGALILMEHVANHCIGREAQRPIAKTCERRYKMPHSRCIFW
jgi:hypothetical protein